MAAHGAGAAAGDDGAPRCISAAIEPDQGETGGGDTTISLRHRPQRALFPTISQAGSPAAMPRRHFGQV